MNVGGGLIMDGGKEGRSNAVDIFFLKYTVGYTTTDAMRIP